MHNLPDVQEGTKPEFNIFINQVGVNKLKVPFKLATRDGGFKEIVAEVKMGTDLSKDIRGVSMSSFIRSFINYIDIPLNHDVIYHILRDFRSNEATSYRAGKSLIWFDFYLSKNKKSPISEYTFPEFYKCGFGGELSNDQFRFFEKVKVQYASYCPCSAELCRNLEENNNGRGWPHAQRSFCILMTEIDLSSKEKVWLEDMIDLVEQSVVTIPFPIIRRVDEQRIAQIAFSNTLFVEDSVRRIVNAISSKGGVKDWIVKCEHEESIHCNNVFAISWKGVNGGFNNLSNVDF